MLTDYLVQADERAKERLQTRVLTGKEGDFAYIEKNIQERKESRKRKLIQPSSEDESPASANNNKLDAFPLIQD